MRARPIAVSISIPNINESRSIRVTNEGKDVDDSVFYTFANISAGHLDRGQTQSLTQGVRDGDRLLAEAGSTGLAIGRHGWRSDIPSGSDGGDEAGVRVVVGGCIKE
jgi:hypothetical protein